MIITNTFWSYLQPSSGCLKEYIHPDVGHEYNQNKLVIINM